MKLAHLEAGTGGRRVTPHCVPIILREQLTAPNVGFWTMNREFAISALSIVLIDRTTIAAHFWP
jgi:hypothetical protein